jgi:hypothetical protein
MPNYDASDRSVAYVRDRIQSLMTSLVSVYTHGDKVLGDDGIVTYVMRNPLYTGKARIWESRTGDVVVQGDVALTQTNTNISIPFGSYEPKTDDVVRVANCPRDQRQNGRAYRVVAVDSGAGQMGAVYRMTVTSYSDSAVWES